MSICRAVSALRQMHSIRRCSTAFLKPKRFYKSVNVAQLSENLYEVHLDKRTLKTPKKNTLQVDSYPLALAIAQEWDSQEETLNVPQMRLTGLQFTVIDNPAHETRASLTDKIMEYVDTDTLLYFSDTPKELRRLGEQKWLPVIDWANQAHELTLEPTYSLTGMPTITDESRKKLHQYFAGMQFAALSGIHYGVEAIKSVLLMLSCLHFHVDAKTAVDLANLEIQYQTEIFSKVEGVHDVQECDMLNRLTAAILFAQLNSNKESRKEVLENSQQTA